MIHVLLVDDEEDICDFLKRVLEDLGFQVEFALLGDVAMRLIKEKVFQLAIVDLKLSSGISGLDVIRKIRQSTPKVIVVAMSGYVDVGLKQETERLGVHGYLEKPDDINPDVFSRKIQSLVTKYAQP